VPTIPEAERSERRAVIMRGAMRCFARKGFSGTSMSEIIAESGVSTGTVYWYFKSKNDLIRESVAAVLHDRTAEFDRLLKADTLIPPSEMLKGFLVRTRESLGGGTAMLLQVWGEALVNTELHDIVKEMTRSLSALFLGYLVKWHQKQGVPKGRAEKRAAGDLPAYMALCQGFVVQCALNPGFHAHQFFDSIDKLLIEE
jgi:AcrR family transcriptional regulator